MDKEELIKRYQEELERVESKLIELMVTQAKFDSYDEKIENNKKKAIRDSKIYLVIYALISALFSPEYFPEGIAYSIPCYAFLETIYCFINNYLDLKPLRKVNVLDLEMELYDYFERKKGLRNGLLQCSTIDCASLEADSFVKMKK